MCPFAESCFWYQALQLFCILSPWQEILTNPTVDNFYISKLLKWKFYLLTAILHKVLRLGHIIAQSTGLNSILVYSYMKSLHRFHLQKDIPSKHACTVSVMKRYWLPVSTSTVTVPACQYTVPIQHRNGTACTLGLYRNGTAPVFKRYKDGTVSVLVVPVYGSGGTKTVQFLDWF